MCMQLGGKALECECEKHGMFSGMAILSEQRQHRSIKRRRRCGQCCREIWTYEVIEEDIDKYDSAVLFAVNHGLPQFREWKQPK